MHAINALEGSELRSCIGTVPGFIDCLDFTPSDGTMRPCGAIVMVTGLNTASSLVAMGSRFTFSVAVDEDFFEASLLHVSFEAFVKHIAFGLEDVEDLGATGRSNCAMTNAEL